MHFPYKAISIDAEFMSILSFWDREKKYALTITSTDWIIMSFFSVNWNEQNRQNEQNEQKHVLQIVLSIISYNFISLECFSFHLNRSPNACLVGLNNIGFYYLKLLIFFCLSCRTFSISKNNKLVNVEKPKKNKKSEKSKKHDKNRFICLNQAGVTCTSSSRNKRPSFGSDLIIPSS